MDKYEAIYKDVYSIFGSAEWQAEGLLTLPENYAANTTATEFIRVDVLLGRSLANLNLPGSMSCQLIVDIFVPAGEGLKRLKNCHSFKCE